MRNNKKSKFLGKRSLVNRKNWRIFVAIVLILMAGGICGYVYYQNQSSADVATGGGVIKVGSLEKDLVVHQIIRTYCENPGNDNPSYDLIITLPDIKLTKYPWVRKNVSFYYEKYTISNANLNKIEESLISCLNQYSDNFTAELVLQAKDGAAGWTETVNLYSNRPVYAYDDDTNLAPQFHEVILGPEVNDSQIESEPEQVAD